MIDYVVPMVFNQDVEWQGLFRKVNYRYDEYTTGEFVRYRSWGTEELLIKLVKKNMPWLRNIIIILACESQVQDWMRPTPPVEEAAPSWKERVKRWLFGKKEKVEEPVTGPQIRIVFHKDFMPDWALPTFNSRAIEMFLKDIPGISDKFLYGNDDMFPLSPLKPEDFFVENSPCIHMTVKQYPAMPNNFQQACMGGLNFVSKEFGMSYQTTWLKNGHSIAPILKSTCEHLWERGRDEIEKSVSPFREPKNFNQYIYSWWHYCSGDYVDRVPKRQYVSPKRCVEDVVSVISGEDPGIVCVNDHECERNYQLYARAVIKELEKKLNE